MISIEELDKTILELEMRDTTFANCQKLADLYIVRAFQIKQPIMQSAPLETSDKSEFLQAVNGKDSVQVWEIISDLMDTIKTVNPKVYDHVLEKILSI